MQLNIITDKKKYPPGTIGIIKGEFAKLDSVSGNGRFYSRDFWTKIINSKSVKTKLEKGLMIGTFEHPSSPKIITGDKVHSSSHPVYGSLVTKKLKIMGDIVYGEAYILDTPVGNLMKTYFIAEDHEGNKLFDLGISSRGGSLKDYIDPESGLDIMNPNDYFLKSFDVVTLPGIDTSKPKLESLDSEIVEALMVNKDKTCKHCTSVIEELNKLTDKYKLPRIK